MCGIAGIFRPRDGYLAATERLVREMCDIQTHRGPDAGGTWTSPEIVLGHRRLSIIDLSEAASQPMETDDGVAIVFNGEIYNFRDLRDELKRAGVEFQSNSDTEVILEGYRQWGHAILDRLVGMFAFAIWDGRTKELFLARDRAGEKPLHYAQLPNGGFAFASEIPALAKLADVDTSIDRESLSLYVQFGYFPPPHSIYTGIRKLLPGEAKVIDATEQRSWLYWDPVAYLERDRLEITEEQAIDQLDDLIRQAVRGQMISDVPLGAFLSGGFDSSVIVSYMTELQSNPVQTFTIGFSDKQFDESRFASAVADHLGTDHTCQQIRPKDAIDLIPTLPQIYGEPFADVSALPTLLLSHVARQKVTVSLSGDGGDEAFGGYRHYSLLPRIALAGMMPRLGSRLLDRCFRFVPEKWALPLKYFGLDASEQFLELRRQTRRGEAERIAGGLANCENVGRAFDASRSLPKSRAQVGMLADMLGYLPEDILVKVDRAAMSVSLETRAPLLDHRILEFALQLPATFRTDRLLFKKLAYRRVPRHLLDRPKAGFNVPIGKWLREDLREMASDLLVPAVLERAGIEDAARVRGWLEQHLAGHGTHSLRLWGMLVLALWSESRPQPTIA